jgi:hypothetical protein
MGTLELAKRRLKWGLRFHMRAFKQEKRALFK